MPPTPLAAAQLIRLHWRLYLFEACELAVFMMSACIFAILLFYGHSPLVSAIPDATIRQVLFAAILGAVATGIILSPMGKRSGAHFNPACTLTYYRLGRISVTDAIGYVVAHFVGAIAGVGICALVFGSALGAPGVEYAAAFPGRYGTGAALAAELFMAFGFMTLVLWTVNRPPLAKYTPWLVGLLIAIYLYYFGPISGVGLNPARSVGSAIFARIWTAFWVYLSMPIIGMLLAAEFFVRLVGKERVLCAKMAPFTHHWCPFLCHYPGHTHTWERAPEGPGRPGPIPGSAP